MLAGKELRKAARVDRAGVRGGLGRPPLAHGVGEPRQDRSKRRLARGRLIRQTLQCLSGLLSIQPRFLLSPGQEYVAPGSHNVSFWRLVRTVRRG